MEGRLFLDYYRKLNGNGLFDSTDEAAGFSLCYTSFDWTETGPYIIAEIRETEVGRPAGRTHRTPC